MYPGSWIVLVAFVVHIIFFIVMSLVSPFYKKIQTAGWGGRALNIALTILIVIILTVLIMFNIDCTITGDCKYMAIILTAFIILIVFGNVVWGIVNHVKYTKSIEKKTAEGTDEDDEDA